MRKILIGFMMVIVLIALGVVMIMITVKPDNYRTQLVDVLNKRTGLTVNLKDPIRLAVSWDGLTITLHNAALVNPSWAHRENMAFIGTFELGLDLLPLLQHKLVISRLTITHADIQLETSPSGDHNWDMLVAAQSNAAQTGTEETEKSPSTSQAVAISGDHLTITNSHLSVLDGSGQSIVVQVNNLVLVQQGKGLNIDFRGALNTTPMAFKAQIGTTDFLVDQEWPVTLDLVYAFYRIQTTGLFNLAAKTAEIPSFLITAGASGLEGKVSANWSGDHPVLKGSLTSTHFAVVDFTPTDENTNPEASIAKTETSLDTVPSLYVFSDRSLGLNTLKNIEVFLDVALSDVVLHTASLQKLNGQITVQSGILEMPLKIVLGQSLLAGEVRMDTTNIPAQLMIRAASSTIDLSDLLALAGAPAVLTGKATAKAAIGAAGDSLHALASSMNGTIEIIADGGEVSKSAAKDVSSNLMELIAPEGSSVLHCLAARFIATNGVIHDNGILIDTAVSTIEGRSTLDMSNETINMMLRAHTRLVGVGGLLPPLYIGGTFLKPTFSVDPKAVVQNVVGILSGTMQESGVPEIIEESGQNACLYTLTHPMVEEQDVLPAPGLAESAQKLKSIGQRVLHDFFGQ